LGFRPFIYRIAERSGVKGYVQNRGGAEVVIHVEGDRRSIERFFRLFWKEKPETFIIDRVIVRRVEPEGHREFRILKSSREFITRSAIPPDFSMCDDCLREVLDPSDQRRFRYPFNSCVICGPRFSMMYDTPWDRENTAMRAFPLCPDCLKEYSDPSNCRRFHAQGISCSKCGPHVWLVDRDGRRIETKDPIREAAKLINEGHIIAIKGVGGFHIACLASDDDVVLELRRRKRRPEKPFAVMCLNTDIVRRLAYVNENILRLLESPQRPIVLLRKREDAPLSRYVAPGLEHVGVFLPYTPLHYLLLDDVEDRFAIMTSGNVHGKPMCIRNEDALIKLRDIVDYFLLHDREIVNRVDDSVLRACDHRVVMLRRGRGYAPYWVRTRIKLRDEHVVIAFGALLQNTAAIMFEDKIVMTQYIGDCDDLDVLQDLQIYLNRILRMLKIDISSSRLIVACDLHPSYETTRIAEEFSEKYNAPLVKVQHHWAHVASAMADLGIKLDEEVVGIAIDGVGYGEDGNIWGCEVIYARYSNYVRVGHLRYVKMLGGDLATQYPARMVFSYLSELYGVEEAVKMFQRLRLYRFLRYGEDELNILKTVYTRERILTSSLGRFLDAVSTLLGVCGQRTYEGEPAMKLEAAGLKAGNVDVLDIDFKIRSEDGTYVIDSVEAFGKVVDYYIKGVEVSRIAYSVQYNIGRALGELARKVRKRGIDSIIVSGGAAVNEIILKGIEDALGESMRVRTPLRVPVNDGGISAGQSVVAACRLLGDEL